MTKRLGIVFCLVAVLCVSVAGQTEIELTAVNIPKYPPLARQARVEGTVKLTFILTANNGEPTNVEVVSGHSLLKGFAIENVKTWKFKNPYGVERKYDTIIEFRFSGMEAAGRGRTSVTFESFHHVVVLADPLDPTVID